MSGSGLGPPGGAVKDALDWISLERRDRPQARLVELIDEASKRYDLSPLEEEFLLRALNPAD